MATSSEVKAGLDEIALSIRNSRAAMVAVKASASAASVSLNALPTKYADTINTINAYASNTTDAFEMVSKAELGKLTTEFVALVGAADAVAGVDLG